ncbi:pleckstrin homology domain-containing family M member 1-like isoform X2 [Myxocyprinus asiaticus]|uniref:pleckstrin homology domain-containing family M member 1-like isoform X2 n=1 Tax=Myxocyprinus asiaticus TaxID=70543 RepID=UPI002221599A|nr:pleckstrin homology domain-containing family M member 1-like isoform X2 [Myxocyprinus asiaticus]
MLLLYQVRRGEKTKQPRKRVGISNPTTRDKHNKHVCEVFLIKTRGDMLATQTPESGPEAKHVKQWIKEKIARTLKALQKRYITTDTAVTSEDLEANLLCCALEAVFIHGIKSKFIRLDGGGYGRKGGSRGALPQPVFWSLLKTVTHRDVVQELERLSFINSDIGRCRAWVRLALNDGLLECYLTSLLREGSNLGSYYQPGALLMDPEDREVLLTLLQGLASLTFQLSYKSAVLNEWTNTPLVLAGLCPPTPADEQQLCPERKESWDTVSQSSGGSGGSDWAQEALQREPRKEQSEGCEPSTPLTSSNLSLDTSGSSQLSSSLSSDSLLQGQELRSPEKERWSCDVDISRNAQQKNTLSEVSSSCSQDLMKEDFDVFIPAPDNLSVAATHGISDGEVHIPDALMPNPTAQDMHQSDTLFTEASEPCLEKISTETLQETGKEKVSETLVETARLKVRNAVTEINEREKKRENRDSSFGSPEVSSLNETAEKTSDLKDPDTFTLENSPASDPMENSRHAVLKHSTSIVRRRTSSDSLYSSCKSTSWISEEDFYKPEETGNSVGHAIIDVTQMNGQVTPTPEPDSLQSPPSVVHRRQNGLLNPFRGLLKLGQLERRSAVGMWWDYYCELSPFELRLYINAEERTCYENLSLLRCVDVHLSSSTEGRFWLSFPGKRLYLRAPSRGEAEDWVDRIMEAVCKLRPMLKDEQWEVLQTPNDQEVPSPPSSPECTITELPDSPHLDWTRHTDPEPDAIKETVVYQNVDKKGWRSLVLSLSLETLRAYRVQEDSKRPLFSHPIGTIRDVVPDVSLGSPAFFKVLTAQETLTLRAESGEEARGWRSLIRGALDSYLEREDDGTVEGVSSPNGGQEGKVHRLVQHRLKGDGALLSHLSIVPKERGLDAQNYKCAGCSRQIGLSLGKARLCEFSGQYYCETCHQGDTSIIPSRMVHNWDLTSHEISRQALKLLAQVEHEPLLNFDTLNPDLFDHTDIMSTVQSLRQRLCFLGDYLLMCRSGISKQILARLQQRSYLMENRDVYSILDLQQIADGHYESYLQSLIQFGSKHVHNCDLCTQRGFICQICNTGNIIFPFQLESTSRSGSTGSETCSGSVSCGTLAYLWLIVVSAVSSLDLRGFM